jgi:pantoate--beta-alanine ligase
MEPGLVALVPTMGYLHEGHLSLVRRARNLANRVWVSIFVNPTQFGPDEDLDRYPRDLERDLELLVAEDVDVVFAPTVAEMYPFPPVVEVGFSGLEKLLCGIDRPGHFAGVGLVVAKLLNIVQPQVAVFGQKDAQQALLIRRLVDDLSFPVQIEVAPTVREPDGLAMSSRNAYLTSEERAAAPLLYQALIKARDAVLGGEQSRQQVETQMRAMIAAEPLFKLEYAECRSQLDLSRPEVISGPVLLAVAARIGSTRLIDNIPVVV